jgi:NAD-dependent SIR2 family protein deacetylase
MNEIEQAARAIEKADGLLITAGAGMGIDSGLPDFRGEGGFWKHYPALGRKGLDFSSIASPQAFNADARLAWGFYGHRLNLYRSTLPHQGFNILQRIGQRVPQGCFVFTSNVDGQFQKAGFPSHHIVEAHGSIHHLQCGNGCLEKVWSSDGFEPVIDEENCYLTSDIPICPHCGAMARPNILMFSDWNWIDRRSAIQRTGMNEWLGDVESLVVIELGAGTGIPTVRNLGDSINGQLIRINTREPDVTRGRDIGISLGALEALRQIEAAL